MAISHFAVDFRTRYQRRHAVDDNNVNRAATYQRFGNVQRLFAIIRLRNQQIVHIHAQAACIFRIQRVLRINKGRITTALLRLRHNVQRHRRLAA